MKTKKDLFKEFRGQNYLEINLNFQDYDKLSIKEADEKYQRNLKLIAKLFTPEISEEQIEANGDLNNSEDDFEGKV